MRFLEKVVHHAIDQFDKIGKVRFVLPGKRAETFLKKHIAKSQSKTMWAPECSGFLELASDHTGIEPADRLTLQFELYKAYTELGVNTEYHVFDQWSDLIINDFSNIDHYLLNPVEIYGDLKSIRDIEDWSLGEDELSDNQKEFVDFWGLLGKLYQRFTSNLLDQNIGYGGLIMRKWVSDIEKHWPKEQEMDICFAGFNVLTKAEMRVIQYCQKHFNTLVEWDVDQLYLKDKVHPAGHFIRQQLKPLNGDLANTPNQFANPDDHIQLSSVTNAIMSSRKIKGFVDSISPGEQVAIVLADEKLLLPVLQSLPHDIQHLNVTMGLSLRYTALYKVLVDFIGLHEEAISRKNTMGQYLIGTKKLKRWLESYQQMGLRVPETLNNEVELNMQKQAVTIDHRILTECVEGDDFADLLSESNSVVENMIQSLVALCQTTIKEKENSMLDKEVTVQTENLLSKLSVICSQYPYLTSIRLFQRIFRKNLGAEKLDFIGEPVRGIQIMGMLETRGLDFDRLLILGADENVLPVSRKPNSFFPYELKKRYGLPSDRDREAIYAYYFYRLLHYPKYADIVFGGTLDETGAKVEPSRYVRQLEYEAKSGLINRQLEWVNYTAKSNAQNTDNLTFTMSKSDIQSLIQRYANSGLSVSAINKYNNCPLDYYYRYVLGFNEIKKDEDQMGAALYGNAVHLCLELLYEPYLNKLLTVDSIKTMESKITSTLIGVLEGKEFNVAHQHGPNHVLFLAAIEMVKKVLRLDENRLKQGAEIIVLHNELKVNNTLNVQIGENNIPVLFRGTIDRVEMVNGAMQLIDYKTGSVEISKMRLSLKNIMNNDKPFQLLLYAWLISNQLTGDWGASIWSLREGKEIVFPLELTQKNLRLALDSVEDQLKEWVVNVLEVGKVMEHNSRSKFCQYCQ